MLQTVAVALLFSLVRSAAQNRKSVKSEQAREGAKSSPVLQLVQLRAGHVRAAAGFPGIRSQRWGKKTILVVRAARLWISASAIPVSPPDPAAEVGGTYI